jgi:hypothetical protein
LGLPLWRLPWLWWLPRLSWMPWLRRLRRLRCVLCVRRILPPLLRRGAFRLHDKFEDLIGRARSSTRPILVFVHVVFGLGQFARSKQFPHQSKNANAPTMSPRD